MHDYAKYFKEQSGFDRFIQALDRKYSSLSKFSGNVKLENISSDEALVFSRLFGTTYEKGADINISIKKFISIMNNSKYTDFDISVLVREYLNKDLITNKEKKKIILIKNINFIVVL